MSRRHPPPARRTTARSAEHDGRIVADIVAEWARRHGRPVGVTLDGPAGGSFTAGMSDRPPGADGEPTEHVTLDAVEFCRIVSRRESGRGILGQQVPF